MLCEAVGLKQLKIAQTLDTTQNEGELPFQDCLHAIVSAKLLLHNTLITQFCKLSESSCALACHWKMGSDRLHDADGFTCAHVCLFASQCLLCPEWMRVMQKFD